MLTERQLFLQFLAQTSDSPLMIEVDKAEGAYIYDIYGKKYIDLISGISVSNIGHRHPKVIEAVKNQIDKYMHVMVYGEYVQSPQVCLSKLLCDQLPDSLNSVYLVNSGTEANEGAVKLAKKYSGRFEVVAFKKAYHGSSQGSLSLISDETYKNPFRPLLPGIRFLEYNNIQELEKITDKTACVIIEPVQAEAGVIIPDSEFILQLYSRCKKTGTLLIFDEIQTGFGRTGKLFSFEHYNIVPDILTLAKGMGGGMPIGAFVSSREIMSSLMRNPILSHITTFGGHPVSAAAAAASLSVILQEKIIDSVILKEDLFKKLLKHPSIKNIRSIGLLIALEFENSEVVRKVVKASLNKGVITDWFLFCNNALRIAPPLTIQPDEIKEACTILLNVLDEIT